MFKRKLLIVAAFLGALALPGAAVAATVSAITTADLNIRVGPGADYARFATIPYGDNVDVHGCIAGYNWCDVSWAGTRGWVSGNYLAYMGERYYRRAIPSVAVAIGVPILTYNYNTYYDRYYVGRHFRGYRFDRHRHRPEIRHERRDHRHVIRPERRHEHRQEIRRPRQEHRQGVRPGRHERRQEVRRPRQEHRQGVRQQRNERRQEIRRPRQEHRQGVRQQRNERRQGVRQERRQDRREMQQDRRERRRGN